MQGIAGVQPDLGDVRVCSRNARDDRVADSLRSVLASDLSQRGDMCWRLRYRLQEGVGRSSSALAQGSVRFEVGRQVKSV